MQVGRREAGTSVVPSFDIDRWNEEEDVYTGGAEKERNRFVVVGPQFPRNTCRPRASRPRVNIFIPLPLPSKTLFPIFSLSLSLFSLSNPSKEIYANTERGWPFSALVGRVPVLRVGRVARAPLPLPRPRPLLFSPRFKRRFSRSSVRPAVVASRGITAPR